MNRKWMFFSLDTGAYQFPADKVTALLNSIEEAGYEPKFPCWSKDLTAVGIYAREKLFRMEAREEQLYS